jgi:hypothetical protein
VQCKELQLRNMDFSLLPSRKKKADSTWGM